MELSVKIKEKRSKEFEYKNKINLLDFKQLALILTDIETYGGNVVKAFEEFSKRKGKEFPW